MCEKLAFFCATEQVLEKLLYKLINFEFPKYSFIAVQLRFVKMLLYVSLMTYACYLY